MSPMKVAAILLLPISLFVFMPLAASACKCAPVRSIEAEYETADEVFVATIADIGSDPVAAIPAWVVFEISESFKGTLVGRQRVTIYGSGCDYFNLGTKRSQKGSNHLIFASRDGADLDVSSCGRSHQLENAADELATLRARKKEHSRPSDITTGASGDKAAKSN